MDSNIVCAYLWEDIIRLGFSPSSTNDKKRWLLQYGQSLKEFWETESYPTPPKVHKNALSSTIDSSTHIGLSFEYAITTIDKFGITLMHSPPVNDKELIWMHDMDRQYFNFPNQHFLTNHNQRQQAIRQMSDNDLGRVIDSLIIHPTPHQHIESPINHHEIRIGGGLLNPFLYLFHLRFQLCPDRARRELERTRLIELFKGAIKNNQPTSINCLMKIP